MLLGRLILLPYSSYFFIDLRGGGEMQSILASSLLVLEYNSSLNEYDNGRN